VNSDHISEYTEEYIKREGFKPLIKEEFLKFLKEQQKILRYNISEMNKLKSRI